MLYPICLAEKQGSGDPRDFFAKMKKQIPNKLLEEFVGESDE